MNMAQAASRDPKARRLDVLNSSVPRRPVITSRFVVRSKASQALSQL